MVDESDIDTTCIMNNNVTLIKLEKNIIVGDEATKVELEEMEMDITEANRQISGVVNVKGYPGNYT